MAGSGYLAKGRFQSEPTACPCGNPDGGQWTTVGGVSRQTDRVRIAQVRDPGFYSVDLEQEDRLRGGHGYRKHVGKSPAELIAYVERMYRVIRLPDGGTEVRFHPAEGSFRSSGDANYYVTRILRDNPQAVERAVAGEDMIEIIQRFGFSTGYEAFRANEYSKPIIRDTYAVHVILSHDARRGGRGYRVVTAYPMNELPNEVPIR